MAENFKVSYSELYTYMKCPRKHYLSYIEKLHKATKTESKRMNIGSIVHELLEAALRLYYNNEYRTSLDDMCIYIDGVAELYAAENRPQSESIIVDEVEYVIGENNQKSWDEDFELAVGIAKRTIKHLDIPNNWRIETINWQGETLPIIEWKFEYPLYGNVNLVGVIDVVMRSLQDDQIYLIDWKTRATLLDDFEIGAEHMSMQLSLYQHVLNSMGVEVSGTITYQIRSAVPQRPNLTTTGKVSRAKVTTDRETFMYWVKQNGQSEDEYADMIFPDESHWFKPIKIIRNVVELQNRWLNVQVIAERMLNDELAPKYETPDCVYCPYFKLCLGEDNGLDNEYFIETQFTKGE